MTSFARPLFSLLLSACAATSMAQSAPGVTSGMDWKLSGDIGIGAYGYKSHVAGRDNSLTVLPFGYADYGPIFWRVDTVGVKTVPLGYGHLEVMARVDLENSTDTKGGISPLLKGKGAIPVGVGTFQKTPYGGIFLNAFQDVGASRGQLFEAIYAAKFDVEKLSVYPQLGLEYRTAKFNQAYYGVVAGNPAGLPVYNAGASLNPSLALAAEYPIYGNWMLNAQLKRKWLGSQVADSPLLQRKSVDNAYLAVSYRFK